MQGQTAWLVYRAPGRAPTRLGQHGVPVGAPPGARSAAAAARPLHGLARSRPLAAPTGTRASDVQGQTAWLVCRAPGRAPTRLGQHGVPVGAPPGARSAAAAARPLHGLARPRPVAAPTGTRASDVQGQTAWLVCRAPGRAPARLGQHGVPVGAPPGARSAAAAARPLHGLARSRPVAAPTGRLAARWST